MDIKPVGNSVASGMPLKTKAAKPKGSSIVKDTFARAKNLGSAAKNKMKDAVRFIRTKSDTNRAVSTLFALATVGVGLGGLMTLGMTGLPTIGHLGLTLAATFGCSYVSHRFS